MAGFSEGLLSGLRNAGQGYMPADPREQNVFQQAGITNPLLLTLGSSLGGLVGKDMRAPAAIQREQQQAQQAKVQEIVKGTGDISNPDELLKTAQGLIKAGEFEKGVQLLTIAREQKAAIAKANAPLTAKDRFKTTGKDTVFDVVEQKFIRAEDVPEDVPLDPLSLKDAAGLLKDGLVTTESFQKALKEKNTTFLEFTDKAQQAGKPDDSAYARAKAGAQSVVDTAKKALEIAPEGGGEATLMAISSALGIPFSEGVTLDGYVKTLQANLAFDRLQAMRDASKTGGALGQVSNIELELLKSSLTSLNPKSANFREQLQKVISHYEAFVAALEGDPEDAEAVPEGYKAIDGTVYKEKNIGGVTYYTDGTNVFKASE